MAESFSQADCNFAICFVISIVNTISQSRLKHESSDLSKIKKSNNYLKYNVRELGSYLKEYDFLRAFCFVIFKMTINSPLRLPQSVIRIPSSVYGISLLRSQ